MDYTNQKDMLRTFQAFGRKKGTLNKYKLVKVPAASAFYAKKRFEEMNIEIDGEPYVI